MAKLSQSERPDVFQPCGLLIEVLVLLGAEQLHSLRVEREVHSELDAETRVKGMEPHHQTGHQVLVVD